MVFSARRLALWNVVAIVGLLHLHMAIQALRFMTGNERLYGLAYAFSLGAEHNIPTIYATLAILFCALLLAMIGLSYRLPERVPRAYWLGLSMIFVFLALDESLQVHEKLIDPMRNYVDASGALHYPWVIPYSIGVLVVFVVYVPFLLRLPQRTSLLFVLAGSVYVTGAVGFEMLSGVFYVQGVSLNPYYVVAQTLEELFEMTGIGIFIYGLANFIESELGGITITIPCRASRI
jgi:hypothetical protein